MAPPSILLNRLFAQCWCIHKVVLELLNHTLPANSLTRVQYYIQFFLSLSLKNTVFQSYLREFFSSSVVTLSIPSRVELLFALCFELSPRPHILVERNYVFIFEEMGNITMVLRVRTIQKDILRELSCPLIPLLPSCFFLPSADNQSH